jgi:hypothetical protein
VNPLQAVLDALQAARDISPTVQYTAHYENAIAIVKAMMMQAEPVAYVDGDDASRRILWEPNKAAFDLPVGTKLYAAPQVVPAICEWKKDPDYEMGDTYHSSCGELWSFIDGGPKENRISYCHHCGKHVKLASAPKGSV